jgi:predicted TIM-barrel fold metal-dependent hydrolase
MLDFKLIAADTHLCEHPRAWERAQKEVGDQAPHIVKDPPGYGKGLWIFFNDKISPARSAYYPLGLIVKKPKGMNAQESTMEDPQAYKKMVEHFNETFTYEEWRGGWDPKAILRDWDEDGVEAGMLFSSPTRYNFSQSDAKLQRSIFSSYNEWVIEEVASYDPKRLYPVPLVSVLDVDLAVKDIYAYAKRGIKTVQIPTRILGSGYYDPVYEPLWAAAQDANIVINAHHNSDQGANRVKDKGGRVTQSGAREFDPRTEVYKGPNFAPALECISNFIYSGIFDRYPKLRLAISEFKIFWVAGIVHSIDYHARRYSTYDPDRNQFKREPSEYFQDNIFFTFEHDRAGLLTTPFYGENNFMFASDYPHHVSTWPHSQAVLEETSKGLPQRIIRKVGRDNAIKVFNLDLPLAAEAKIGAAAE